jgi:hypothetical protein
MTQALGSITSKAAEAASARRLAAARHLAVAEAVGAGDAHHQVAAKMIE